MSDDESTDDPKTPTEFLSDLDSTTVGLSPDSKYSSDTTTAEWSTLDSSPDFDAIDPESVVAPDAVEQLYEYATEASRATSPFMIRAVSMDSVSFPVEEDVLPRHPDIEPETATAMPSTVSTLFTRMGDAIDEREAEGFSIDTMVLGQPQYTAIHAFSSSEYSVAPEMLLPVDVIVVPGPQIHAVVANDRMLEEYLHDD